MTGFSKNETTWLPVHSNYRTLNLAAQKVERESHYHIFKNLTALKRTVPAVQNGSLEAIVKGNEILAIVRTQKNGAVADHAVVLVMNFSPSGNQTVNLTGDVPTNLGPNGVVQVATLNSNVKKG